jgi:hypothetical protein
MYAATLVFGFVITAAYAQGPIAPVTSSSSVSVNPGRPIEPCTTLIRERARCCPPLSSYTSTKTIDCHGCVLSSVTTGPMCLIVS